MFISADADWMNYLAVRGLIRIETRVNLLTNRLVLRELSAVPAGRGIMPSAGA